MHIHLDRNKLHLQVLVGTLEHYAPSEKIKKLQERVTSLKEQLTKFQDEVIWPELQAIEKEIAEENEKFSGPREKVVE